MITGGLTGPVTLVWLGAMSPRTIGGGRTPAEAWDAVAASDADTLRDADRETAGRMEAVRSWMRHADSALARGDLTAFARAWEALRGLLLDQDR
jgi:hypothetical protein